MMHCLLRQHRVGTKPVEKKAEDLVNEKEQKERAWTRIGGDSKYVRDVGSLGLIEVRR